MRRLVPLALLLTLGLVACQDVQAPPANFQVRDGAHPDTNGVFDYPYLYFLPPIVPSPTFPDGAQFDSRLLSYLSVRVTHLGPAEVNPDGLLDAPNGASCSDTDAALPGLAVDTTSGTYSTSWQAKKKGNGAVTIGDVYRICVWVAPPEVGGQASGPRVIGYRDVMPDSGGADQPRNTEQDPVYQFSAGSNVPVKFKVLSGLLSQDLCAFDENTDSYDCTAQILGSYQNAYCENNTCAMTTGQIEGGGTDLFVIEKFGLGDTVCTTATSSQDGTTSWLDVDIPQYAGCVRITVPEGGFTGFTDYGTIGACFYESSGPNPLKPEQDESIQLHVEYSPGRVDALPWTTAGIEGTCEEALAYGTPGSGTLAQLAWHAKQAWRTFQRVANPWFAPPRAWAFHTGFGGHTGLKGDTTSTISGSAALMSTTASATMSAEQVFKLAWALPSQMAPESFCAGTGCTDLNSSPLVVSEGDAVTVAVHVTDNGAEVDASTGGRTLTGARDVLGAQVHFAVDSTDFGTVPSTDAGISSFQWSALGVGTHTITASGFGIGTDGPFDAFDGNTFVDQPVPLGTGTLSFQVKVCAPGPQVDGYVTAADGYPTTTADWDTVPVNLGGNVSGMAYMLVQNSCDSLYVTFLMPSDDSKSNALRFVFAQDKDNSDGITEGPYDDILSLSSAGFRDRYLSQDCIGSKQANCGPDDPDRPADGIGAAHYQDPSAGAPAFPTGTTFLGGQTWYVYEMAHPLDANGSPYDFTRAPGETLYFYLAVSLGSGTKGNTEWPDQKGNFKNYGLTYTVK